MEQISTSIVLNDWESINEAAQSLQSTSGFIGAGRLYYACHYIQEAYSAGDIDRMMSYYPILVEAAIEFKRYSRRFLAE